MPVGTETTKLHRADFSQAALGRERTYEECVLYQSRVPKKGPAVYLVGSVHHGLAQPQRLGGNRYCDTRSDSGAVGQTRREPAQNPQEQTRCGVLHTTKRRVQRQFGAETSGTWVPKRLGSSGRISCMAECWIAS